eukprot:TRINITY_DN2690_c0_g1_i1.p1 TRINITY_DN2690_c0_g1~~TRINITY_DN2690_c0_g1_i1.p1  ORF type:complete len:221 (-),score=26.59 TRINITY_DN2690_c0_g1_i1:628-1290(-)
MRFMLRWPTTYMCHLINRARHTAYGPRVARQVLTSEASQRFLLDSPESRLTRSEKALFQASESKEATSAKAGKTDAAYMVRPIVSLHVRQGDKGQEMKLFSFAAHMWLAESLRKKMPHMNHIWLSTEMESVIAETTEHPSWTFLFTRNPRQNATTKFHEYETEAGVRNILETSLVNLLIACECDYFVGTLGSNWNRLINELRSTNGGLKATYLALNSEEW